MVVGLSLRGCKMRKTRVEIKKNVNEFIWFLLFEAIKLFYTRESY